MSGPGPPTDPPPLPFQLQDPERLRAELTAAGLRQVRVDQCSNKLVFSSGSELWDWTVNSNPLAESVLRELSLTGDQIAQIRHSLERMIRERAGSTDHAVLTGAINIGVGIK